MKSSIKIFADFNNADSKGRVRLTTAGTRNDLERMNLKLESGIEVLLDDNEGLMVYGIVQFSDEEDIWVAIIDWDGFERY